MFPPQKDRTRDPSLLPCFRGSLFSLLVKGGGKHFGLACLRRGKNGCWKPNAKIRHPRSPPTPYPALALALGPQKASGFSGNRFKPRFLELGLASSRRVKEAWSLGEKGESGPCGGSAGPPHPLG